MKKLRAAAVGLLTASLLAGSHVASADPDAVARAKADLDRIRQQASALDQEIIEVSVRAEESAAALTRTKQDLQVQEQHVKALSDEIGQVAMVQYQTQGMDVTTHLFTAASDAEFLAGLGAIQSEANRSLAQLQDFQVEQARLDKLRSDAADLDSSVQADKQAKLDLAKQFDAKEAEAEAVYKRLSAEEAERLRKLEEERQRRQAEADRRAAEEAAQRRERAERQRARANQTQDSRQQPSTTGQSQPSTQSGTTEQQAAQEETPATQEAPAAETQPAAGGRAARAVAAARAQVGKRYVWGTSGPNTFDCSGLTSYAYRQVGINITRSSRGQLGVGRPVSKGDLQPGDLVFYYSPVSHVGMYVGNGQIVHAANPRRGVRYAPLNSMPYSGARRLVG